MAKKQSKAHSSNPGLIITAPAEKILSAAQAEFNRLMKQLETARAKHLREQVKLDKMLLTSSRNLMPLIEQYHRTEYEILNDVLEALPEIKLSKKRRQLIKELVCAKGGDLLSDPTGLSEEEISALDAALEKLNPHDPDAPLTEEEAEEFDFLRGMMEVAAENAGVYLDLSDLDPKMSPQDFERTLMERMQAAAEKQGEMPKKAARKQTKAQLAKAKMLKEQEDAKKRDLKSLYKQLAKALHPDLESDPTLKIHKEDWMKRLTTAYADGDLRGLLQIEMEWLGEEATNLSAAGDEKLKVYCAVLKEQIREQKERTQHLTDEPQYFPIRRYIDPYTGKMAAPSRIVRELEETLEIQKGVLENFRGSKAGRSSILASWADMHELAMRRKNLFR